MRLRARGHHRENIENEILSEWKARPRTLRALRCNRYVPIEARRNVEEHVSPDPSLRADLGRNRGIYGGVSSPGRIVVAGVDQVFS
jgi:hypothetical protein